MLDDDYEVVATLEAFKKLTGCTYKLDKVNLKASIVASGRKFEVSLMNISQLNWRLKEVYKAII